MGENKKWSKKNKLIVQLISVGLFGIGGVSIFNITLSCGGDDKTPMGIESPAPTASHIQPSASVTYPPTGTESPTPTPSYIEPSAPVTYPPKESLPHSIESPQESVSPKNDQTVISGNSFSGYITADKQEDYYTYTPGISGIYRFDFDSDNADVNYKFYVLLPNGEQVASSNYSSGGKTVELQAGQTYSIVVKQYTGKAQSQSIWGCPMVLL